MGKNIIIEAVDPNFRELIGPLDEEIEAQEAKTNPKATAEVEVVEDQDEGETVEEEAEEHTEEEQEDIDLGLNPIAASLSGVLHIEHHDDPWVTAIDVVNYPVMLKPLYYHHDDEYRRAEGRTNTGRDSEFLGVVVDRLRNGDLSAISVVTGLYETVPAANVYLQLKEDLEQEGIDAVPYKVYVSGDGGKHELWVRVMGLDWVSGDHEVAMHMIVNTSVDGKKRHSIRMAAVDSESGVELVGIGSSTFNLGVKHTKAIHEHQAAFSAVIENLVAEWNDMIIPSMELLNDAKFDKGFAVDILKQLLIDADIPERHQDRALHWYEATAGKTHTMYGVLYGISSYLDDSLEKKPERLNLMKEKLAKKSAKIINKTLEKLSR